jgi:hypothetical protein
MIVGLTNGSSGLGSAMRDEIDKRIRLIVNAGDQAPVIKNQY